MQRCFAALESRVFDVLVIGGGITGAGVARDAAMRGLSVAIIDKGEWASGASGKSSRLIHGGIRYLERGEIRLVRESVREREILLRIAPALVKPLEFTWPVYRAARLPKWKLRLGLTMYDLLAGKRGMRAHHSLTAAQVLEKEPCLRRDGLVGGATYYDAATDDAALTRANIRSAAGYGAIVVDHARAESTTVTNGRADGALVHDMLAGSTVRVAARVTVRATGPWQAKGSKGSHIVIPGVRVGNHSAVTMISPDDGRVMFTLPSTQGTIVGTTDIYTSETPDDVRASEPEIDYLLRAANHYFPDAALTRHDVTSTWAGIRPLATAPAGTRPSSISREHRISTDKDSVIVVTGGKLTTYRSMAAEVVDHVERALSRSPHRAATDREMLPAGN
ncbi:MAG TPA: glycerol-3-phosphate dehydrogenase/oxidase [Gemmatimonadaceae bacterium]|nr:glycerol-3-phosphate dehydrogenase/oxidase [Gemmatimonadaceae bacterium]